MESQRNILLIGLLFVSFLLWQQWQADKAPKPVATESSVVANATTNHSADVPVNVHTKSPKNTKHKCAPDAPANLRVQLQENRYISVKPFTVFDLRPSQTVTPPSVVDVDLASSHQLFGLSMSI